MEMYNGMPVKQTWKMAEEDDADVGHSEKKKKKRFYYSNTNRATYKEKIFPFSCLFSGIYNLKLWWLS